MTNPAGFDFTKFVPGFDFLKNLTPAGGASSTAAPGWVAPTLDPEELDKRIQELKTVQFWLEQNTKAVGATIQALEVQRMTLNTLKGMNMSFSDLADSLKVKPHEGATESSKYSFTSAAAEPAAHTPDIQTKPEAPKVKSKARAPRTKTVPSAAGVDPAHWWGALTDQFQHIATHAMNDMAHRAQAHAAKGDSKSGEKKSTKTTASAAPKGASKSATKANTSRSTASKSGARKTSARSTATKSKR